MVNLFAFRATLPKDMKAAEAPIGPNNNTVLTRAAEGAGVVVAGWGTNGSYLSRDAEVSSLIPWLYYLRLTKDGFPGHPLFLPKILKPKLWKHFGALIKDIGRRED